ncbi:MAG: hypothetical protein JJE25_10625, partial [Bacteroidia bacterium]|nr:hypothetical protein [Bacteroidia bacterium]
AYELPVTIPVLKEGSHEIKVRAGIIVNGISATRVYYPFYNFYVTNVNLTSGVITNVSPVVNYYSGTFFSINENFSGAGYLLTSTPQSDTSFQIINNTTNSFEGPTAAAYLDASHFLFECASDTTLSLPTNTEPVYMELNYKTNTEFSVGVFAVTAQQVYNISVVTIRANSEWKKIYIDLSGATASYPTALGFKPYIHMERNSSVGDAELYFDNVKVVRF